MSSPRPSSDNRKNKVVLLEHTYDGIQEYDQKLPNWWLATLYGAIVFSVFFWFYYVTAQGPGDVQKLKLKMAAIEAKRLESSIDVSNSDLFWQMASNAPMIQEGQKHFMSNCAVCHGPELLGGVGENLVDNQWKHGHFPANIYNTIYNGVQEKGMQAWGSQLGQKKIAQIVAFILSKHGDRQKMEAEAVVKK